MRIVVGVVLGFVLGQIFDLIKDEKCDLYKKEDCYQYLGVSKDGRTKYYRTPECWKIDPVMRLTK